METDHDHHRSEGSLDEVEQTEENGRSVQSGQDRPDAQGGKGRQGRQGAEEWLIPGVPIVRNSTPRPFSFDLLASQEGQSQQQREQATSGSGSLEEPPATVFPTRAPVAPPLPEEYEEEEDETISMVEATPLPLPGSGLNEALPEFLWLFEYGLEMDSAVLNGPKSLDGYALLYGPAALKGYRLAFDAIVSPEGHPLVTLVPATEPSPTVWGVLYRIPARLIGQRGDETSVLDKQHFAAPPAPLFEAITVVVCETYRNREIPCMTYAATATALQQYRQRRERERQDEDAVAALADRLLTLARQHALPDDYLQELALHAMKPPRATSAANAMNTTNATNPVNNANTLDVTGASYGTRIIDTHAAGETLVATSTPPAQHSSREQDTEPLPVITNRKSSPVPASPEPDETIVALPQTGMMVFAVYLGVLLVLVLALAVLQGMGFASTVFTASFTPLGVPWFVLVYGLLGGCASSIITVSRRGLSTGPLPRFVLVTWFTRPFIGSLLAVLVYLFVNSGLLALAGDSAHSNALFSLLAALAGLTEGWLFARKR